MAGPSPTTSRLSRPTPATSRSRTPNTSNATGVTPGYLSMLPSQATTRQRSAGLSTIARATTVADAQPAGPVVEAHNPGTECRSTTRSGHRPRLRINQEMYERMDVDGAPGAVPRGGDADILGLQDRS